MLKALRRPAVTLASLGVLWLALAGADVGSRQPTVGGTIQHISSVTHVSGLVSVRDDNCLTCRMRIDHYNALAVQPHISGSVRAWQVAQCGDTATIAVATNANRRDIILKNIGTTTATAVSQATIYIGFGVTGHVALTAANGYALHNTAGANQLILSNYNGPIACIATSTGQTLGVLEVLR